MGRRNNSDMIIITGASKGIGAYLSQCFKCVGDTVVDRRVDVTNYNAVKKMVSGIQDPLEITLLNCAGISYTYMAHKADPDMWGRVIDVNLKGSFNMIRCVLPLMRDQGYGRIINFSSIVTKLPTPGVSAYAASKAGLIGMTKSLAAENASRGITINAICLGYADIGMGVRDVPSEYQDEMRCRIPARRFCEPIEIYSTVKYLIQTEYVNGASIDINGGL